jgi:predicted alpha/beta hydrolase family esterase
MGTQLQGLGRRAWIVAALILLSTNCGSAGSSTAAAPSDPPIFTSPVEEPSDPMSEPAIDGLFPIGTEGRLALRCWGVGTPVIVLEAGTDPTGGIGQFSTTLAPGLATHTMTCTYDRLGAGLSDPAPHHRRTLDDLVMVLHRLLRSAHVGGPYLLVGSSGGGAIAIHYAGTYQRQVAGLVLLDVSAPEPELAEEFPEEAADWDHGEFVDWYGMGAQLAYHRRPLPEIPVRIVTASDGQSSEKDQSFWLRLSPLATQETLEGGHVISSDDPDGVVAQIIEVLGEVELDA